MRFTFEQFQCVMQRISAKFLEFIFSQEAIRAKYLHMTCTWKELSWSLLRIRYFYLWKDPKLNTHQSNFIGLTWKKFMWMALFTGRYFASASTWFGWFDWSEHPGALLSRYREGSILSDDVSFISSKFMYINYWELFSASDVTTIGTSGVIQRKEAEAYTQTSRPWYVQRQIGFV